MTARETVVVCFGDSNTHGSAPVPLSPDSVHNRYGPAVRWPGVMAAILGPGFRVIEEGLPGRTTVHADPIEGAHMNGRLALPMVLGTHAPIDILVIMLGTNDLKARFAVTAQDIADSLERLIREARTWTEGRGKPVPKILLVAPTPIMDIPDGNMFSGGVEKSAGFSVAIRDTAERAGVAFLDAGDHVRTRLLDGVHLDADQHAALGRAMADAVRRLAAA
ncbi:SGNH/GDSL hydrolase family protein [Chthonobacter albigriseus]|uniref:SGNH/GDSL hydrolase family protein n=1 Tax=Chthonobacter albigriseus TaxID=1683161 RepID=UPI0015EF4C51|nr:SGNH/GDSL hydrolase family protein [Chthonobacter albigriseus]